MCAGHKLNKMEAPSTCVLALFGGFLLLFGVLPFYGEAAAIAVLGNLDKADLDQACAVMND